MSWDIRTGRWQDVLVDATCDAWISDPPYGQRTHESNVDNREDGYGVEGLQPSYAYLTTDQVHALVARWSPRVRGWMGAMTSHDLIPAWEAAYAAVGRYAFAPVPCVMRGMSCRMLGDGPSSWTVYWMSARPRDKRFFEWGTLPGAYVGPRSREAGGGRGKPAWLMNALVRDYSRPGDVVCDPFAGWGSTLVAAVSNLRTAIGCDVDPAAVAEATRRLGRPQQHDLFTALEGSNG